MSTTAARPRLGLDLPYLRRAWREMLDPRTVPRDLMAGLVVAFVSLPLNLAFAVAANVDAAVGLVTGIVGGFVAGLFGGSRYSVTGPAAVMGLLLIQITDRYGMEGLFTACALCGLLQVAAGLARLGVLARYIPLPVVSGFTSGLAVLIILTQLPTMLGLQKVPDLLHEFAAVNLWTRLQFIDWADTLIGVVTALVMLLVPRHSKVPGALVALVAGTAFALVLDLPWVAERWPDFLPAGDIERIGSTGLSLPAPRPWGIAWPDLGGLAVAAVGLFFLATVQSMLNALSCDSQTGSLHHSNQELIGQGLANVVVPFFGGIPVTGVFARSAAGIRAGAATRLTTLCHAVILLLLTVVLARQTALVPLAALAAILIVTGWRMIQWDLTLRTVRASPPEGAVLLTTFALTVITTNMMLGVFAGMAVAVAVVAWQAARQLALLSRLHGVEHRPHDVLIQHVAGPLFFGATPQFAEAFEGLGDTRVLILDLERAWSLDTTACQAIQQLAATLRKRGGVLLLSGLGANRPLLEQFGTLAAVGKDHVFEQLDGAVKRAEELAGGGGREPVGP
jgi:sulfate permease, SulP family